jgi:hypothetical protein
VVLEVSEKIEKLKIKIKDRNFYKAMDEMVLMCMNKNILTYNNIFAKDVISPAIFDDFVFSDGNGVVTYPCKIKIGNKNSTKVSNNTVIITIKNELLEYYRQIIQPKNNNNTHNRVINDNFIIPLMQKIVKIESRYELIIVYLIQFIDTFCNYTKIKTKVPFNIVLNIENFLETFAIKMQNTDYEDLHINLLLNFPFIGTLKDLNIIT